MPRRAFFARVRRVWISEGSYKWRICCATFLPLFHVLPARSHLYLYDSSTSPPCPALLIAIHYSCKWAGSLISAMTRARDEPRHALACSTCWRHQTETYIRRFRRKAGWLHYLPRKVRWEWIYIQNVITTRKWRNVENNPRSASRVRLHRVTICARDCTDKYIISLTSSERNYMLSILCNKPLIFILDLKKINYTQWGALHRTRLDLRGVTVTHRKCTSKPKRCLFPVLFGNLRQFLQRAGGGRRRRGNRCNPGAVS